MLPVIGLMSGTSLDGVDAALVETDGQRIGRCGPRLTIAYDAALRADLRALLDRAPALAATRGTAGGRAGDALLARCEAALTRYHAEAVAAIGEAAALIGFHGQTILHRPRAGLTWQIGDAAALARACSLPVVHDFRAADIAAGGEGAPLVPVFHAALLGPVAAPVAVLNLGGVANLTLIGPGEMLVACDTGPGNALLDDWVFRHSGARFDADGALAAAGRADPAVLARLLAHPYFARPAPKSLDRLDFAAFAAESGLAALSAADGATTLAAFTAGAVAATPLPVRPTRWFVAGGGRHNPALMAALRQALAAPVEAVEALGWDGDALEAQCFAFLAARARAGLPLSYPATTGVRAPMPGGVLTLP